MAFSTAGSGAPQMNVTPLIDVLLVLLVIFMIVVINEKQQGLEAQIPQESKTSNKTPEPVRTIVIQVREGKSPDRPEIRINEEAVTWDRLRDRLIEIYAGRIEKVAYVKADHDIEFQRVADVIDTAHYVGIDRVGLLHDEAAETRPPR